STRPDDAPPGRADRIPRQSDGRGCRGSAASMAVSGIWRENLRLGQPRPWPIRTDGRTQAPHARRSHRGRGMTRAIQLSYDRVGLAAFLILINGAISLALRLGLERRLAVAALATVVQLLLIGLVLDWIFRVNRWYLVLGLMVLMTLIAGGAAI